MKMVVGALLAMSIGAMAVADTRAPMHLGATGTQCIAATLKQLERDWAAAEQAGDSDKIGRILADDWTGVSVEGKTLTKEQLLEHMKRAKRETMSVEFGPMNVKVLGNVAIVQGSEVETGAPKAIWMDVFANRDGKWVAIRSQSTRIATVSRPRWPI